MAIIHVVNSRKIEITLALPDGSSVVYSEADVIRCVLSLRSDLSIVNPTLPESEFEADIYTEDLSSHTIESLPDETSVTYRTTQPTTSDTQTWGPLRYFYTDDVSWSNNVLHIHARDQVHKLDEELPAIYIGQRWQGYENKANSRGLMYLFYAFCDAINGVANGGWLVGNIIEHLTFPGYGNYEGTYSSGDNCDVIMERMTRREFIAKLMNLCRFEFGSGFLSNNRTNFYLTYVDAGIPKVSTLSPASSYYSIDEEDCGDIQDTRPENISQYNFKIRDVWPSSAAGGDDYAWPIIDGGSASVVEAVGMSLSYRDYTDFFDGAGLVNPDFGPMNVWPLWYYPAARQYLLRARPYQTSIDLSNIDQLRQSRYGYWLLDNKAQGNPFNSGRFDYINFADGTWTTPMPHDQSPSQRWADYKSSGLLDASATEATLQMAGYYYDITNERTMSYSTGRNGAVVTPPDVIWNGFVYAVGSDNIQRKKVLPDMALDQLSKRSTIGGSFVHRGDPYWQPRDHFHFYFRAKNIARYNGELLADENGNELVIGGFESRTIETITTTHEKGGTISEVTYKKGIV